jgi:hypothetical protein
MEETQKIQQCVSHSIGHQYPMELDTLSKPQIKTEYNSPKADNRRKRESMQETSTQTERHRSVRKTRA